MLFTAHSHSGQFCTHAVSTLQEVIEGAIARGLSSIALTEHIPRDVLDYYPGEESHLLVQQFGDLWHVFDAYYAEAVRLRGLYGEKITILIGFEGEWIRSHRSAEIIAQLRRRYSFDMFLGSIHHVLSVPIDFDDGEYERAKRLAGGTDELLAARYFDEQLEMLHELKPPIVSHFDLIRLKSPASKRDRPWTEWGHDIWVRIMRNLEFVAQYGGVLEVNTAALRKGLEDVYPRGEIIQQFLELGGRLTLSDDSHGIDQLCTHYDQAMDCIERAGVRKLWYLCPTRHPSHRVIGDQASIEFRSVGVDEVRERLRSSSAGG